MKQVQIIMTREYYGPQTTKSRLIDNETGGVWQGTRKEAVELIGRLEDEIYHTAHNECGRPVYSITYSI